METRSGGPVPWVDADRVKEPGEGYSSPVLVEAKEIEPLQSPRTPGTEG